MAGVRSVAVNTDLSMKDIELLQGEIGELRTEVERLHQKLVRTCSRGAELKPKHEDLFGLTWPPLHCKLEPSPVLIDQWEDLEPDPSPPLSLKACKAELHVQHEDQDQLLELFSGPRPPLHCKAELNPILIKSEDVVGRKQSSLLALKQELCLVPECKPEPHLTLAEDLYCTIYKLEPEPLAITCSAQAQSGERPVLGTIRTCSVKLVDCRKALDVSGGEQNGDEGDEDLSASVQVRSATIEPGGKKKNERPRTESPISDKNAKSPYPCPSCGRSFKNKCNLFRHLTVHSKEDSLKCARCDRSFKRPIDLNRHEIVHAAEQFCECPEYGKRPAGPKKPRFNRRVLSEDQRYVCQTCGKGFSDWSTFRKHKRMHAGEKPYGCDTHGKRLSCSSTHRTHQRTHSGDEQHTCITCGKQFSSSAGYHKHLKTHTGPTPYPCAKCGRTFTQSTHLRKHRRTCTRKSRSKKSFGSSFCKGSVKECSRSGKL